MYTIHNIFEFNSIKRPAIDGCRLFNKMNLDQNPSVIFAFGIHLTSLCITIRFIIRRLAFTCCWHARSHYFWVLCSHMFSKLVHKITIDRPEYFRSWILNTKWKPEENCIVFVWRSFQISFSPSSNFEFRTLCIICYMRLCLFWFTIIIVATFHLIRIKPGWINVNRLNLQGITY